MTSISGATFIVTKIDQARRRDRLYEQWRWLSERRDCRGLVHVMGWKEDSQYCGYEMEYLEPLNRNKYYCTVTALTILKEEVWPMKFSTLWSVDSWPESVRRWWVELPRLKTDEFCAIHGDPTVENLMMRPDFDRQPVLIDPLPDVTLNGRVPSIRAVDLGKLLQSAFGYEEVKNRKEPDWHVSTDCVDAIRRACVSYYEWQRTCAMALLHIHRFIPYQDNFLRKQWETWLPDIEARLRLISTEY